jgi:signal transduction histidine kinase
MSASSGSPGGSRRLSASAAHRLLNYLGIIQGFVDLVLDETAETDPRRQDILQIRAAVIEAVELLRRSEPDTAGRPAGNDEP